MVNVGCKCREAAQQHDEKSSGNRLRLGEEKWRKKTKKQRRIRRLERVLTLAVIWLEGKRGARVEGNCTRISLSLREVGKGMERSAILVRARSVVLSLVRGTRPHSLARNVAMLLCSWLLFCRCTSEDRVHPPPQIIFSRSHSYKHTHIYIYIYIYYTHNTCAREISSQCIPIALSFIMYPSYSLVIPWWLVARRDTKQPLPTTNAHQAWHSILKYLRSSISVLKNIEA